VPLGRDLFGTHPTSVLGTAGRGVVSGSSGGLKGVRESPNLADHILRKAPAAMLRYPECRLKRRVVRPEAVNVGMRLREKCVRI
jgi:hypothetical protein